MERGRRGDALNQVQFDPRLNAPERAVTACEPATRQEALAAIGGDGLQIDHRTTPADRHQELMAELAQVMRPDALAPQIGEGRISRAAA